MTDVLMEWVIEIIGFLFLWGAVCSYRKISIKFMSNKWWIQMALISIGVFILKHAAEWTKH